MSESFQDTMQQQEAIKPGESSNVNVNSIQHNRYVRWNCGETAEEPACLRWVLERREPILSS